jgi:hypothetical protein
MPAAYHGDSVVLMALRTGAVRLVLNHAPEALPVVDDLLWQAAVRIEDGTVGVAERRLREAQSQLADALDRKAPAAEIQGLVDRLREALVSYMTALSMRPARAAAPESLSQAAGTQTNMLTPKDMEKMLQDIRDLSVSGASDAARDALLKLGASLEGLHGPAPSFSEEMQRRARDLNYPEGTHDSAEHTAPVF